MTRTGTRTGTATSRTARWIHRPRRHHWLADTRDQEYSAGRLMSGYGKKSDRRSAAALEID